MDAPLPSDDARRVAKTRLSSALLWSALIVLLLVAQALLVALTFHYRSSRTQQAVDAEAAASAAEFTRMLGESLLTVLALPPADGDPAAWKAAVQQLLLHHPEMMRVERRDAAFGIVDAVDSLVQSPLFARLDRQDAQTETVLACNVADRRGAPSYSGNYYVPQPDGTGIAVLDLCAPRRDGKRTAGYVIATYSLTGLLDRLAGRLHTGVHDLAMIENDGAMLAHSRGHVGAGVFIATHPVDLSGNAMQLRLDSAARRPSLFPDLVTALVMGLSLSLLAVVILLARDVRKRSRAEAGLAEALAFRTAMEDSVVTGLRARDLQGRTTYVNPAFCAMVGYQPDELIGHAVPPYWPPDQLPHYLQRQDMRLTSAPTARSREAFETVFVRKNGERFPVTVFEAPLRDHAGAHRGWMSAALDMTAQRRIEDLARQQQERLQATARLATVGEMASLLSHELNQPLSAIAAYATGSMNTMDSLAAGPPDPETWEMLRQATRRIAEQAERAGAVIRSVHDFVRRRERAREDVAADLLIDAVLPLVRMQARKCDAHIVVELPSPVPRILCDRAMVEQVLLNLTRNGIQAMLDPHLPRERTLTIRVESILPGWVRIAVIDRGSGIAPEVADQLFTPFFTTRSDGMGLGLSVCRSIIEQHGGALAFETVRDADAAAVGTEFHFTLPTTDDATDGTTDGTTRASAHRRETAPADALVS